MDLGINFSRNVYKAILTLPDSTGLAGLASTVLKRFSDGADVGSAIYIGTGGMGIRFGGTLVSLLHIGTPGVVGGSIALAGLTSGTVTIDTDVTGSILQVDKIFRSSASVGNNSFASSVIFNGDPPVVMNGNSYVEHKWEQGIIQSLSRSDLSESSIHYRMQRSRQNATCQIGDEVFLFAAEPHNGVSYVHTSGIRWEIDAAPAAGNMPTGIVFESSTTNTFVDRWTINSSGHYVPKSNNAYDVGSASMLVRNIYVATINATSAVFTGAISTSISDNSAYALVAIRNTSGGGAAGTRINVGNDANAGAATITMYGSAHSTKANIFEISTQIAGDLSLATGSFGEAVRITNASGLVTMRAAMTVTGVSNFTNTVTVTGTSNSNNGLISSYQGGDLVATLGQITGGTGHNTGYVRLYRDGVLISSIGGTGIAQIGTDLIAYDGTSTYYIVQGKITTDTAAETGLAPGALAALTTAYITFFDKNNVAYHIPAQAA